jgi:hypothetical protein
VPKFSDANFNNQLTQIINNQLVQFEGQLIRDTNLHFLSVVKQ